MDAPPLPYARVLTWCDRRPLCAEAIARRLLTATPAESPDYPWAILTLGWCLMIREKLEEAFITLERARELLEAAGLELGVLRARHGLLLVGLLRGLSSAALPAWEELASAYDQRSMPLQAARVRIGQIRCLNILWRSTEALSLVTAVQPTINELGNDHDRALLSRMVGMALMQEHNQMAEAAHLLAKAEAAFRRLRIPGELARTWFEQGRHALLCQQFETAWELHERALRAFQRLDMPVRVAYCKQNLGHIASSIGKLDQAITYTLSARDTFIAIGQTINITYCTYNLGLIAFWSGLFELALAAWRQTEEHYVPKIFNKRNQVEALIRLGHIDAAEAELRTLIPAFEQLNNQHELAEVYQNLGDVLVARGAFADARIALQRAEQISSDQRLYHTVGRARMAQGWIVLATGEVEAARHLFAQAAHDLSDNLISHWSATYGLARCAEALGSLTEALHYYRQACDGITTRRTYVAEIHASSGLSREALQLVTDAISFAAAQGDSLLLLQLAEQQRALGLQQQLRREPFSFPAKLRSVYETRRATLRQAAEEGAGPELDAAMTAYLDILFLGRHANLSSAEAYQQPDLDLLRLTLTTYYGDAWTVVIYLPNGEQFITLTITPDEMHTHTLRIDKQFERMLERATLPRYRAYTYQDLPFQSGQRQNPWADLATLGAYLIPPEAAARLAPEHRLLIAPGGSLHSLPWAALRLHEQWLAEQAVIQIIPGLQIWADLVQRPPGGSSALLIGISQFAGRAADLPSALPSLDLVERYWPGHTQRLEDGAVTRTALLEAMATGQLSSFGLIHLATHGQLTSGLGLLAHLKLADDDLLADEVAQLGLAGALVVLVACEGALGETLPGEELLSLNRALLAAGARDVVASLWELYDLTILPILEPFYMELAAGRDAPRALVEAQRRCIKAGQHAANVPLALPFVWASLCAIGAGTAAMVPAGGTTPAEPEDPL